MLETIKPITGVADTMTNHTPPFFTEDELTHDEFARAAAQTKKPAIFNYFVGPHVPETVAELLSHEGEPVMFCYENLAWKSLTDCLQTAVDHMGLPKGIKVFVSNDALDLFDIYSTSATTGARVDDYNPLQRAADCFTQLETKHFRSGVVNLPEGLHLNPGKHKKQPPVTALFISIRFATWYQVGDYLSMVTKTVLGISDPHHLAKSKDGILGDALLPDAISDWLCKETGVLYWDHSTVLRLSITT